jgi:hypothetical protein
MNLTNTQKKIISDVVDIYNRNLSDSLTMLYTDNPDHHMVELMGLANEMAGEDVKEHVIKTFEEDFFKYCDLKTQPDTGLKNLTLLDLVIVKFILTHPEWIDEQDWDRMELSGLITKVNLLIENPIN